MAAVEQEENEDRESVTQLEFRQAMRDFKVMFPEMDEDVIEVVLRSNNGAVDSTIDALLSMSTDNENERLRTELESTENDELPPCYSPSTPPPSYNQAVPFIAQTPAHGSTSVTEGTAGTSEESTEVKGAEAKQTSVKSKLLEECGTRLPDIVENGEASLAAASKSHSIDNSDVALRIIKGWNPPLLGELPPTFLKVARLDGFPRPARKVTILSSTLLQQRMQENERQRHTSLNDPNLSQILEDERIALFLQNEEFLQELKDNKEFISTLNRASSEPSSDEEAAAAAEEPAKMQLEFSHQHEETDAVFREKIKNMGKVSRKKFTQLAKLFSRRKRRPFKPILGDGSNPSRDNLLQHEDEYSENSDDSENDLNKKDTWNSHVGGPGSQSQTIERSKLDS